MTPKEKQTKENRLQFRLPVQTHIDIKVSALQSRKDQSDLMTEILEEAMAGTLGALEDDGFQVTSATVDNDLIQRFKQFAKSKGVPQNTLIIRAVQAKLQQKQGEPK